MNQRFTVVVVVVVTLAMASGCQSRWEKIRDFQPKVGMTPEEVEVQLLRRKESRRKLKRSNYHHVWSSRAGPVIGYTCILSLGG
jgi:hypothetical protein